MKSISLFIVAAAALALPSASLHSQMLAPTTDPLAALQSLQKVNEDLLKRQDASLKDLVELTNTAKEARFLVKRG